MKVYFIGAGPGDPELLTVRGQRLVARCPLILYAGSLVPEALLAGAAPEARRVDTAPLSLEEILAYMEEAQREDADVARLHSGDASLYGALGEQLRRLDALEIPWEIVPGVGSAAACAAALGCELTVPGVAQTVIHTRYAGKTPMPDGAHFSRLAQRGCTLAVYLSTPHLHRVVAELLPHYGADCPSALCYRVSQPEEHIVRAPLGEIVARARQAGITRSALFLVGAALAGGGEARSFLYNAAQAHIYRPRSEGSKRRYRQ